MWFEYLLPCNSGTRKLLKYSNLLMQLGVIEKEMENTDLNIGK